MKLLSHMISRGVSLGFCTSLSLFLAPSSSFFYLLSFLLSFLLLSNCIPADHHLCSFYSSHLSLVFSHLLSSHLLTNFSPLFNLYYSPLLSFTLSSSLPLYFYLFCLCILLSCCLDTCASIINHKYAFILLNITLPRFELLLYHFFLKK